LAVSSRYAGGATSTRWGDPESLLAISIANG
jgi:hypothetical protein